VKFLLVLAAIKLDAQNCRCRDTKYSQIQEPQQLKMKRHGWQGNLYFKLEVLTNSPNISKS